MNEKTSTGVSSDKEKVKESQSRNVTPSLDTHFGCRVGGITQLERDPDFGRYVKELCD